MKFKTGVKKDGKITGMHLQTLIDGGAYGSYGVASTFYAGALQTTTYHIPRYLYQGCRTFTNKPPCGLKRVSARKSSSTRSPKSSRLTLPTCGSASWNLQTP